MTTAPLKIGLLGGGQLGQMLCEATNPDGFEVVILDAEDAPAKRINGHKEHVTGSFKDAAKVRELAEKCDVLTVEIEHVNTDVLEEVATKGVRSASTGEMRTVPVHPSWRTLRLVQDKYLQKEHFHQRGVPIARQMALDGDLDSLKAAYEALAFPFMVKARTGSYDGRGNFKVKGPEDFAASIDALKGLPLYAEKWVPFVMELAVMVIRTEDNEGNLQGVHSYPVVETIHEDDVCKTVIMPPRKVGADVCAKARRVAEEVISSLWGRGVFAVEMFLLEDGTIMVNEVAPRPHNSGHYTIESVPNLSQYKAQAHAIMGYIPPQLKIEPAVSKAIMLNILGGALPHSHDRLVHLARTAYIEGVNIYLHLYGKASKPGRKIGHITFTSSAGVDLEQTIAPFINEVDKMRLDRINTSPTTMRPSAGPSEPKEAEVKSSRNPKSPLVVVTMGSDSDLGVLSAGLDILEKFGVPYDCTITSAHRTPARMTELAHGAAGKGVKVLIAAAGGAAHLPGMLASETTVPVIGVPIKATHLDGNDSLLSIVQMPRGIPVATVGINNSTNAALLAVRILGSYYPEYQAKMAKYQETMKVEVEDKAAKLENVGYQTYLAAKAKK
ncbi:Phosphoribosylaminoimidazole carboxylase-like protein [Emericellopsis cladophorae]|uniref:Phosphoribosylaminoimidazole carboxylase n=1 Tax=Emericellopsis cladophorae TaxID=2686198 RepID=A0A9P9Y9W5_9HYPO|nr:Phosphoribosylaminoimidazole carboxylase-like protein [Emericellopsis cladophorae]KAI6785843.1 Phosphoribosylaminoimidazole carboxylase-like protein [Emericellopsis cladophorae]